MKKIFFFAASLFAAMTINAQIVVSLDAYANFIDFQREGITASTTVPTSVESTWFTTASGSIVKGFLKSDGTEAANSWNAKASYNTTCPVPEWTNIDSLNVGSMFRGASGSSIVLGAFTTTADGKLRVFFQPNGDSERGVSISLYGGDPVEFKKSGKKLGEMRPVYAAEIELEADSYAAGDVVIKMIANTSNIFGVQIENLASPIYTGLMNNAAAVKAAKTIKNGQLVLTVGEKKYNVLGAEL